MGIPHTYFWLKKRFEKYVFPHISIETHFMAFEDLIVDGELELEALVVFLQDSEALFARREIIEQIYNGSLN